MEEQRAFMGEHGLRAAKVQQVHRVRPRVWRNINAVRRLFCAALPDVSVECGLGNAVFQNLRGFEDTVVLLEKPIEPFADCHATTPFLLILYPKLAGK